MGRLSRFIREGRIAALLFFGCCTTAAAHGVRNDVRVELAPVRIEGIVVEVHQDLLAPQLAVSNRTGKVLEILDDEGRAFLRIGPTLAEADYATEAYHLSRIAGGGDAKRNTLSATPRWARVNVEPSYGWFDYRIATAPLQIPYAIEQIGEEIPFGDWKIPARLDGKPIEIRGVFLFTPPPKGVAVARFTGSVQPAPGVVAQLSPGPTPAVFLRNTSAQTVAVLDARDRPFLKIGKDGVWADTGNAAWRASGANVKTGETGWKRISKANSHTWLESRAAWRGKLPKPLPANGLLNQWSLPLLVGDVRVTLTGMNQWVSHTAVADKPVVIPFR